MYNQNKVGDMPKLQEGVHFEVVKNKIGYPYNYALLDHECWCPKEGIVEIRRLKNNLTTSGTPKHDDSVTIKRFKDKRTELLFGIHNGVDDRTGDINHREVTLEGNMQFDLSIPYDRRVYIIAMLSPAIEGSPNQSGKPSYKLHDKQILAAKNIDKRTLRRRAEDIIESLKEDQLHEMAENMGINVKANNNHKMLLDEMYRHIEMEGGSRKFIDIYESKDREFITIFNRATSLGIITHDYVTNSFSFGGIPLGFSKDAAINFLIEKSQLAHSIKIQCDDKDKGSKVSMSFIKNGDTELEILRARIAELEGNNKVTESADVPKEDVKSDMVTDEDFEALKLEAKELKVAGFALMKKETLREKVEAARLKIA